MNGPEHYREGETLLKFAGDPTSSRYLDPQIVARAQAHLTAALVAAVANHSSPEEGAYPLAAQPEDWRKPDILTWREVLK